MTDRSYLGEFELMILLAVLHLGDEAYGVPISRALEAHRGRTVSVGSVYAAKRYFRITKEGLRQVRETRRVLSKLWNAIPELKWERV
jgi:PadR family transcriptional regulator, regulatory protein PadR